MTAGRSCDVAGCDGRAILVLQRILGDRPVSAGFCEEHALDVGEQRRVLEQLAHSPAA